MPEILEFFFFRRTTFLWSSLTPKNCENGVSQKIDTLSTQGSDSGNIWRETFICGTLSPVNIASSTIHDPLNSRISHVTTPNPSFGRPTRIHTYDNVIWSHESHVTHTHQQRRGRQEGALRCWSSAISLRDMPGLVTAGNPSSWSLTCFSVAIVTEDRMQCEQKKTSTNWSVCATTLADLPQFYVNGGSSNNEIWYTD